MNITRASLYVLQALVFMARRPPQEMVSAHRVALAHGIPEGFLVKGLLALVRVGILHSIKGPHGGYRLGRPPKAITLLEVVEAVDGPLQQPLDFTGKDSGPLERKLQAACDAAAGAVRKELLKVRLVDLAGK